MEPADDVNSQTKRRQMMMMMMMMSSMMQNHGTSTEAVMRYWDA
jgi:hypothetical protein